MNRSRAPPHDLITTLYNLRDTRSGHTVVYCTSVRLPFIMDSFVFFGLDSLKCSIEHHIMESIASRGHYLHNMVQYGGPIWRHIIASFLTRPTMWHLLISGLWMCAPSILPTLPPMCWRDEDTNNMTRDYLQLHVPLCCVLLKWHIHCTGYLGQTGYKMAAAAQRGRGSDWDAAGDFFLVPMHQAVYYIHTSVWALTVHFMRRFFCWIIFTLGHHLAGR